MNLILKLHLVRLHNVSGGLGLGHTTLCFLHQWALFKPEAGTQVLLRLKYSSHHRKGTEKVQWWLLVQTQMFLCYLFTILHIWVLPDFSLKLADVNCTAIRHGIYQFMRYWRLCPNRINIMLSIFCLTGCDTWRTAILHYWKEKSFGNVDGSCIWSVFFIWTYKQSLIVKMTMFILCPTSDCLKFMLLTKNT